MQNKNRLMFDMAVFILHSKKTEGLFFENRKSLEQSLSFLTINRFLCTREPNRMITI